MSSLPGLTLEKFLSWQYDVIVDNDATANASLHIAEVLGNIPRRLSITKEEFEPILSLFEPYREYVEDKLFNFDKDNQSWRMYASYAFDNIPESVYEQARKLVMIIKVRTKQS